jgi:hypothetical protein
VYVYINMNDDKSMLPPAGPKVEESPLRLLEYIPHSRNMQKKQEMHTLITNMILIVYGHRNFAMGTSSDFSIRRRQQVLVVKSS